MKRYITNSLCLKRTMKALLGGVAVAMFASCEDFLTIYPTDRVVFDNYWQEKADVEGMVNNCYRTMVQSGVLNRMLVWGEMRSDNVSDGNVAMGGDLRDINEINLVSTNGYCSWADFYKVINNCNIVISQAGNVEKKDPDYTPRDRDITIGEMYALRALCHFYLVRTFGAVPLLTEAKIDDSQDLYPKQEKPLVVLDAVIADLKMAESMVMASGAYLSNAQNKGRITADAVRAILADALLWRAAFTDFVDPGEFFKDKNDTVNVGTSADYYSECIEYCNRIINDRNQYMVKVNGESNSMYKNALIEGYPLMRSYATIGKSSGDLAYEEVFGTSMNSIPESIFELQLTGKEGENENYMIPQFYGRQGSNALLGVGLNLLDMYKLTDYRRESFIVESKNEDDPSLIAKYTSRGSQGDFNVDGETPRTPIYREAKNKNGYYFESTNWIIYRMSDVMLMKAEAHAYRNQSGDLDEAFKLVKAVYDRSNNEELVEEGEALSQPTTAAAMRTMVLEERQRELAFEGKRWYDLVRTALRTTRDVTEGDATYAVNDIDAVRDIIVNGKYKMNQKTYSNKMPDIYSFFFPISESEINAYGDKKNLLKQNPAYETESSIEQN